MDNQRYKRLTRKVAEAIVTQLWWEKGRLEFHNNRKRYLGRKGASSTKDVHPKCLLRKLNRTKKRNGDGTYNKRYLNLRDQLWMKFEKLAYEVVHKHYNQKQYPKISQTEKLQEARVQLLYLLNDGAFITKMIKSKYEPSTIIFTKLREILAKIFNSDDYKLRSENDGSEEDPEQIYNLQEVLNVE